MEKSNEKELGEKKVPAEKQKAPVDKQNAKKSARKDKNKKPNFFVRIGRKLKETFSELKRVTWPTFGAALKSTGVVLVIVLIFVVLVTCVNVGFSELLGLIAR